jgi:hypothetical protein
MLEIALGPPGWFAIQRVRSYALPAIATQQLADELFFAMFAIESRDSVAVGVGVGVGVAVGAAA